jgi:DNA-binding PadR family transcriptional regulator
MRHHEHGHHHRDRHGSHHGPDQRHAHGTPLDAGERHGRHRHGGGRRHRLFDHGDLRFILLTMIADKPAHGYDLIKALEERMGGGYSPSPGVVYPTLTMLEEQGYAAVTAGDGKKLYTATEDGKTFLRDNKAMVDAIQARIGERARERGAEAPARIIRAVENLKTALRLRLGSGPIPEERAVAIAAAIDAAAAEAERD